MEELIVLVNFNTYLGGGETLFVRFSKYLERKGYNYISVCLYDSYIYEALNKNEIPSHKIKALSIDPNLYYLDKNTRENNLLLLKLEMIQVQPVRLVSFCLRDLYICMCLSKFYDKCSISHLVLHIEDDLYLSQNVIDKLLYKVFNKRVFNNEYNKKNNRSILSLINSKSGIISMATIINIVWKNNFNIEIPDSHTIPLPSFSVVKNTDSKRINTKKIIWIGRIVDFKIPSLCAMIDYVSNHKDYTLTIVGDGNLAKIKKYIKSNSLDSSRLFFVGEISYENLDEIIRNHSIGYAMGTSLVELAKYGIPVIIALANYKHTLFKRRICGGLFFDQLKGCDGSELQIVSENTITTTIDNTIKLIEDDYLLAANSCYLFAKNNFSMEQNFDAYYKIISQTKMLSTQEKQIDIPYSSKFRRYLFYKQNQGK